MKTIFCFIIFFLFIFSFDSYANIDRVEELDIVTKKIKGAKIKIVGKINAPVEYVWDSLIDFNNHAQKYPRIEKSICVTETQVEKILADNIKKKKVIYDTLAPEKCDPYSFRKNHQIWTLRAYQEVDYPFPLSNRWFFVKIDHNESKSEEREFLQSGEMIFGKQDIYKLVIGIKPHPDDENQTQLKAFFRLDPGGIITGWMIKIGSKQTLPKLFEIIESEARKRAGLIKTEEK